MASQVGFSTTSLTVIATVISEVARNIVEYAEEGEMLLTLVDDSGRRGIRIVARDRGPGIADVSCVLRGDRSIDEGHGIGLTGARRLMDNFAITSEVGMGTTVTMEKWTG